MYIYTQHIHIYMYFGMSEACMYVYKHTQA